MSEMGEIDSSLNDLISKMMDMEDRLRRIGMYPVELLEDGKVNVACVDPMDFNAVQDFEILTDLRIKKKTQVTREECNQWWENKREELGVPREPDLAEVMNSVAEEMGGGEPLKEFTAQELADMFPPVEEVEPSAEAEPDDSDNVVLEVEVSPVVTLVNRIIEDAFVQSAACIYLLPDGNAFTAYLDVRGEVTPVVQLPMNTMQPALRRLKVMAGIDPFSQGAVHGLITYKKFTGTNIDCRLNLTVVSEGTAGKARLIFLEGDAV